MTVREFVSVGLRFFALWLLLTAFKTFEMLASVETFMRFQPNAEALASITRSTGVVIALLVATALFLWIACRPVAIVLTKGAVSPQKMSLTPGGIVTAGCILLGVWGAKDALIPLIEIWVSSLLNSRLSGQSLLNTLSLHETIRAASLVAELVVSFLLLFKPHQISAFLLRNGNIEGPSSPEEKHESEAT